MSFYSDFANWWPLMSSPAEYVEEAAFYRRVLAEACVREPRSLLELGSGGGNNASHMKAHFGTTTLVDLSPGMLKVSRALNPTCEHVVGDMRDVRLGRRFDCVFVHDAVTLMTTEADVRRLIVTAYEHCEQGGAALFCPDYVKETFSPDTDDGGHDSADGRSMRWFAWTHDPDPTDDTYAVDYAYFLRDRDRSVRIEHERSVEGLFAAADWLQWLTDAGFDAKTRAFRHSEGERELVVFVARKR